MSLKNKINKVEADIKSDVEKLETKVGTEVKTGTITLKYWILGVIVLVAFVIGLAV